MSFLKSAQVRAALVEINELQEDVMKSALKFPEMTIEVQYEHIEDLEDLLEKQRIMYTRLSLSDDPEAKAMKESIDESTKMLGLKQDSNPALLFKMMQDTIVHLRTIVENRLPIRVSGSGEILLTVVMPSSCW